MKKIKVNNEEHTIKELKKFRDMETACDKYWIHIKGKKYLFKQGFDDTKSHYGEVFCSYILKRINAPSNYYVNYDFAEINDGRTGTICENFLKINESLLNCSDICFQNYCFDNNIDIKSKEDYEIQMQIYEENYDNISRGQYVHNADMMLAEVEKYAKNNNLRLDKKDTEKRLNFIFLMDLLLCQSDRHMANIAFIKSKGFPSKIEVAPMFDNGFCYGFGKGETEINYSSSHKSGNKDDKTSNYPNLRLRYGKSDIGRTSEELYDNKYFKDGGINISDMFDLIKEDKDMLELYNNYMKLDFKKEITAFEKEYHKRIPKVYKENVMLNYDKRLFEIDQFIEKINRRLSKSKTTQRLSKNINNDELKM